MPVRSLAHERITLPSGNLTVELSLVPPLVHEGNSKGNNLAILLHPWSRLGGNMDDPVLRYFVEDLRDRGYHVITYNSRGVGKSSGWPSFSGLQEAKDLEDVVQWAVSYVPNVQRVLLIGYSYGALITSLHPVLPSPIKTSHILLSYPLDKRSLLTFFHSKDYAAGLTSLVRDPASNVLLVFGDVDQFTGLTSYQQWAKQVSEDSAQAQGGHVGVLKVDGASHFWDEQSLLEIRDFVAQWLDHP